MNAGNQQLNSIYVYVSLSLLIPSFSYQFQMQRLCLSTSFHGLWMHYVVGLMCALDLFRITTVQCVVIIGLWTLKLGLWTSCTNFNGLRTMYVCTLDMNYVLNVVFLIVLWSFVYYICYNLAMYT